MSFIHVAGPHYVKRSLVFVNSFDRVKEEIIKWFRFLLGIGRRVATSVQY